MTPEQKLKWAILERAKLFGQEVPAITPETIDSVYDAIEGDDYGLQDAREEVRTSGIETGIPCEFSRNYESESVAAKMPDGSWVGWTHWYGGGKHSEPSAIDWMDSAYDVTCVEEEKLVTVRTFTKP